MTEVPAPRIRGAAVLAGVAGPAGDGRRPAVWPVATPALDGERFRRATRECLLAVAVVRAAVQDADLAESVLAGTRTGVLYVSATAYASANLGFLVDERSTTLHFPYTAPSAVPAEVTIALSLRGPYVNLMGGGATALYGLWYAARWLADGAVDRVLLLAVEAVREIGDLFLRAGRLYSGPLVEGAACLLLEAGSGPPLRWATATPAAGSPQTRVGGVLEALLGGSRPARVTSTLGCGVLGRTERRALARWHPARGPDGPVGETLAWGPFGAMADREVRGDPGLVTAAWRGEYGAVLWPPVGSRR